MITAQIGLIDPNDYWSTARSGGKDGLGAAENGTTNYMPWIGGAILGSGLGLLAGYVIGRRRY